MCLGGPTTGFEPMEVLTSSNAGLTWVERCANGPNDLVRIVGSCPGGGYPKRDRCHARWSARHGPRTCRWCRGIGRRGPYLEARSQNGGDILGQLSGSRRGLDTCSRANEPRGETGRVHKRSDVATGGTSEVEAQSPSGNQVWSVRSPLAACRPVAFSVPDGRSPHQTTRANEGVGSRVSGPMSRICGLACETASPPHRLRQALPPI